MLRKLKGFTLIELLIVIAIIAILTVAFLPTLRGGQSLARDAAKKALIGDIATMLESKFNDAGVLPAYVSGTVTTGCLTDYAAAGFVGEYIKNALGRVPEVFPEIKRTVTNNHLCSSTTGTQIFFNRLGNMSYIMAVEVENSKSANVEAAVTSGNVTSLATVADALGYTDGALPTDSSTNAWMYLVAK